MRRNKHKFKSQKKERENRKVQKQSQHPQKLPEPRFGILKDVRGKFCDIYQSQIEPSERQQSRTVKFLTPEPDRGMENKVTNELNHVLDDGHNESEGFNLPLCPNRRFHI